MNGCLGNFSMYQRNGKTIMRQKGGGSKEKIKTAKSCAPIRESNSEFATVSTIGMRLRRAIGNHLKQYSDASMIGNLVGCLKKLIAKGTGDPGERTLDASTAPEILTGFEFNKLVPFDSCFKSGISVEVSKVHQSAVWQASLCPASDICFPEEATSFALIHTLLCFPRFEKQANSKQYLPVYPSASFFAATEMSERYFAKLDLRIKVNLSVQLDSSYVQADASLLCIVGIAFYKDGQGMKGVNAMKIVKVVG